MPRTRQVLEAAAVLSNILADNNIPHAFSGGFLAVTLGSRRETEELYCIVEGGFKRVRNAVSMAGNEDITTTLATWSNKLYATYQEPIPPIEIEILNAGEEGPRRLDSTTIMAIQGVPFLSITEYLRSKVKSWASRGEPDDVQDILFVLARYWEVIDINRIHEHEMERFVSQYGKQHARAAEAWRAVKQRYGDS